MCGSLELLEQSAAFRSLPACGCPAKPDQQVKKGPGLLIKARLERVPERTVLQILSPRHDKGKAPTARVLWKVHVLKTDRNDPGTRLGAPAQAR